MFSLILVAVWILDNLCSSHIVQLESSHTRVEISNRRGTNVAKDAQSNQH